MKTENPTHLTGKHEGMKYMKKAAGGFQMNLIQPMFPPVFLISCLPVKKQLF
jgi:hypothetical protein